MKRIKNLIAATVLCASCMLHPAAVYASGGLNDYDSIDHQLSHDVERYHIPAMAVAVVDRDGVLFEKTYGECESADQPFIIGSMSKSFTALSVMQLTEQGKVDLDSPIDDYIDGDEWFSKGTDHGRITVRDLMNQTSGIQTYQELGSLESTDSYGTHVYANANYGLLGLIVESASGMDYGEYVTQNIFTPLGMEHSAASLEKSRENGLIAGYRNFFGIPVKGEPDYPAELHEKRGWTNVPGGYLSASLSDMEKYLRMYLCGGADIVSGDSIDTMFYKNVPDGDEYYGMGWVYSPDMYGHRMISHAGLVENYTSNMFIMPDEGTAVVVLVDMNDYLVGNGLLAQVVGPLFGVAEKEGGMNSYIVMHIVIDAVYLLIFSVSLYSLFTLKKWKKKAQGGKRSAVDILRHLLLPAALLALPPLMGTPLSVIWLFVKDLWIVLVTNSAVLFAVGIYKAVYLYGRKQGKA